MDSISANPSPSRSSAGSGVSAELVKLHEAAQQMEALFVDQLLKEMRKSAPPVSLTGKVSNAERTFGEMLDEKRSEQLAQTGSLGIGRVLEAQLRAAVLGAEQ